MLYLQDGILNYRVEAFVRYSVLYRVALIPHLTRKTSGVGAAVVLGFHGDTRLKGLSIIAVCSFTVQYTLQGRGGQCFFALVM